jgi:hypothetical protein
MGLSEFITFLEPDPVAGRAGALCMGVADFAKIKIALESVCRVSRRCTKEVSAEIETAVRSVGRLQTIGTLKREPSKPTTLP